MAQVIIARLNTSKHHNTHEAYTRAREVQIADKHVSVFDAVCLKLTLQKRPGGSFLSSTATYSSPGCSGTPRDEWRSARQDCCAGHKGIADMTTPILPVLKALLPICFTQTRQWLNVGAGKQAVIHHHSQHQWVPYVLPSAKHLQTVQLDRRKYNTCGRPLQLPQ